MGTVRIGTCGFSLRQAEFFETFDVVELQQTFYQPPALATAQRWRRAAPDGFEFTLKAFQAITHAPASPSLRRSRLSTAERGQCGGFRDTPVVRRAWKTTLELAHALDAGLVVFTSPASFRPTDENIANLIRFFQWAHRARLRLAWEPRGEAWTDDLVRTLCVELSLTHVVDPLLRSCRRPRPPYYRLLGAGTHAHAHTDEELRKLHGHCAEPLTYCLFNNAWMKNDARRFQALVADAATGHRAPGSRSGDSAG